MKKMVVLGFSSSPVKNGNVDRMVKKMLETTGADTLFLNLHDLSFGPCLGCAHLCASDNYCKLDDDLLKMYPVIEKAEALVLGSPNFFNKMNSLMAMFLERMWSFRHNRFPLMGKPYALIASGGFQVPESTIGSIKNRMNAYRASFVGSVAYLSRNASCHTCGYGLECTVGSLYKVYGEEGLERLRCGKDLYGDWEAAPEVVNQVKKLGIKLKQKLE
jgi:multimeric flavodoxin WrbA